MLSLSFFSKLQKHCYSASVEPYLVKDINPSGSSLTYLTNVDGTLYFKANNGTHGIELWKSDGTAGGTVMVKDINPSGNSNLGGFTNINGTLYFQATDETNGSELWKSDGEASDTVMVKDINPSGNSNPGGFTDINGTLYFQADDGTNGIEIWRSDGTAIGTVMVKDINPGIGHSFPSNLANINGIIYFQANDGTNGAELWKSDGTASGTVMVKDINLSGDSSPYDFANINGTLYFTADDGLHGSELWKLSPDTSAPTITGLSNDSTATKSKIWNWSSDEYSTYRYIINQEETYTFTSEEYSSTTSTIQSSGNGTYYLHIQAKDYYGNESETMTVSAILDNTAPVITILGSNPVSVYRNSSYLDAGATALDNIDETSSVLTVNNVNTSVVGRYIVEYSSTDTAGNISITTRVVNVVNRPGGGLIMPGGNNNNNNSNNNNTTTTNNDDTVDNNQQSNVIDYTNGRFVKEENSKTVYFINSNNIKYPYPDQGTWESYYGKDFRNVEVISKEELNTYSTGSIVSHKEGSLIKSQDSPKAYKVISDKAISWIVSENVASRLFGNTWNKIIRDIADVFFREYSIGNNIE